MSFGFFKKQVDFISEKIKLTWRNIDSNATIFVDGFDENDKKSIKINNPFFEKGLFCIELVSSGNIENHLGQHEIDSLHRKYKYSKDGFLLWAMIKKGGFQKNYLFSYSKSLLEYCADFYGVSLLDGPQLLDVLYDLQLDNQYIVNKEKKVIERKIVMSEQMDYEFINTQFNSMIRDCVFENLDAYNIYQATHYKKQDKKTEISKLFNLKFNGVIWTYMSFNKGSALSVLYGFLQNAKNAITKEKNKLEIFREAIESGDTEAIVVNSVLMIKKEDDTEFLNAAIGDCLKMVFKKEKEGRSDRKKLIKFTPLIFKNPLWNRVLPKDYFYDFIASTHKDFSPEPHFFGVDNNGAFTNYNLKATTSKKKNTRPHFFIGGKTGSSKTTFANAMISQMVAFDWDKNTIGNYKNVKIRQFDIKDSLGPFARHVNRYNKGSVSMIQADLNEFSYNLINIGRDEEGRLDENDIAFAKMTTSFILFSKDKTQNAGLTFDEEALYGELIHRVYEEQSWEDITIEELSLYQRGLSDELLEIGYSLDNELLDIKESEYTFLKKPTISSIVKILDLMTQDRNIMEDPMQLQTVQGLRKKITVIASYGAKKHHTGLSIPGFFARYERTNIDSSKQWLYFDMDKIKELDEYAPIQWILLHKITHEDKKNQLKLRREGKEEPLIIYYIEEAHNMFNNPIFRSTDEKSGILDKQALEWRSYNLVLAPISQKSSHIPPGVYDSLGTKFFLFPEKSDQEDGKDEVWDEINSISKIISLSDASRELMYNTPRYHACAINEHGAFVIGIDTDERMRKVFDGKMIYKD